MKFVKMVHTFQRVVANHDMFEVVLMTHEPDFGLMTLRLSTGHAISCTSDSCFQVLSVSVVVLIAMNNSHGWKGD